MILTPTEFCKIPGIPAAAQEAYTLLHVEWTRERQAAEFWYTQKMSESREVGNLFQQQRRPSE